MLDDMTRTRDHYASNGGFLLRVNMSLSGNCGEVLDRLCAEKDLTRPQIVRQALGIMQMVHDAQKRGHFVGITDDYTKLHTVLYSAI